ncbi:fimbrial biogenesis chaperone [Paenalcaligenes suwonensis]|uniref:fimbrial biogenesis chaperone n=1 Tax=Paenalcaligenes suwonensis TaxID=1202713 RepID=UPI00140AA871|nr:molecular chaperone [Paenalcaligenes suwonensis]NHC62434.1 molecular chaperone [Paenalcaligenes suwonensis]
MLRLISLICALVLTLAAQPSVASIALNTTRVILANGKNEASFGVRNMGGEILIQSWLDADNSTDSNARALQHFALTPQLVRVRADSEQVVRILYEGVGAPSDRESMLWLNVQEIPQRVASEQSTLQLAILQRIKVFYRPPGLPGSLEQAVQNLEWSYSPATIRIANSSPYHVTLAHVTTNGQQLAQSLVIPPGETYSLAASANQNVGPQSQLSYSYITDFGAYIRQRVQLNGAQPSKPLSD